MTFEKWMALNAPRDVAYTVLDIKRGWDGALSCLHPQLQSRMRVNVGRQTFRWTQWHDTSPEWLATYDGSRVVEQRMVYVLADARMSISKKLFNAMCDVDTATAIRWLCLATDIQIKETDE